MSEGDEAGVADEEVEAGGEERPDDDVVGEKSVVARPRGGHEQRDHEDQQRPRNFPGHAEIAAEEIVRIILMYPPRRLRRASGARRSGRSFPEVIFVVI